LLLYCFTAALLLQVDALLLQVDLAEPDLLQRGKEAVKQ
jgi:hypothetical protein